MPIPTDIPTAVGAITAGLDLLPGHLGQVTRCTRGAAEYHPSPEFANAQWRLARYNAALLLGNAQSLRSVANELFKGIEATGGIAVMTSLIRVGMSASELDRCVSNREGLAVLEVAETLYKQIAEVHEALGSALRQNTLPAAAAAVHQTPARVRPSPLSSLDPYFPR